MNFQGTFHWSDVYFYMHSNYELPCCPVMRGTVMQECNLVVMGRHEFCVLLDGSLG